MPLRITVFDLDVPILAVTGFDNSETRDELASSHSVPGGHTCQR